jgi:hypothetical protein
MQAFVTVNAANMSVKAVASQRNSVGVESPMRTCSMSMAQLVAVLWQMTSAATVAAVHAVFAVATFPSQEVLVELQTAAAARVSMPQLHAFVEE